MRAVLASLLLLVGFLGILDAVPPTKSLVLSVWKTYLAVLAVS